MAKMRTAQITRPGGPFEIVEREIPQPDAGWVRLKVQACGICHSDSVVKEGHWPGLQYPRVPGHEVVGIVDAVGAGVSHWKTGQRVGVGWHGGHCGHCGLSERRFLCLPGGTTHGPKAKSPAGSASSLAGRAATSLIRRDNREREAWKFGCPQSGCASTRKSAIPVSTCASLSQTHNEQTVKL
jgi:Zn-dependent alcohol dehydrogenase